LSTFSTSSGARDVRHTYCSELAHITHVEALSANFQSIAMHFATHEDMLHVRGAVIMLFAWMAIMTKLFTAINFLNHFLRHSKMLIVELTFHRCVRQLDLGACPHVCIHLATSRLANLSVAADCLTIEKCMLTFRHMR
jgi:hypothetical protein